MTGVLSPTGAMVTVQRRTRPARPNEREIATRLVKAMQDSDLSPAEAHRIVRRIATGKSTFYSRWNDLLLSTPPAADATDEDGE